MKGFRGFKIDGESSVSISYCDFVGCSWNGVDMATDRPVIVGNPENGNVAFPSDWTKAQRREWRVLMDMSSTVTPS